MHIHSPSRFAAITIAALLSLSVAASITWAADAPAKSAMAAKESREAMAQAHEKMAACLRSDRDVSECRKDMMASCKQIESMDCPMMKGGMKKHPHGKSSANDTASSETPHKH